MPTLLDAVSALVPGLALPDAAQRQIQLGVVPLLMCNFTTTYRHPLLPYLRLCLAIPALLACWNIFALAGADPPVMTRRAALGVAFLGVFGTMKVVEVCLVGFWNGPGDWPRWVKLGRSGGVKGTRDRVEREKIPFGQTILGRLAYAGDLLTASGASWYRGRAWNWAAPAVFNQDPAPSTWWQFTWTTFKILATCYVAIDFFETILSSRSWDTSKPTLVTSLPPLEQLLYSFTVCGLTCFDITFDYTFVKFLFSLIPAVPSTAWPPLSDAPFASASLAEFWAVRWHPIFRRSFDSLSLGFLTIILFPVKTLSYTVHPRAVKLLRSLIIFSFSWLFHLIILWALPRNDLRPYASFWNPSATKFFLSQPLGLLIEVLFVFPLTERLVPMRSARAFARRAFAWGWLLWSGRYFADLWFYGGMLDHQDRNILFSPIRGVLRGEWVVL